MRNIVTQLRALPISKMLYPTMFSVFLALLVLTVVMTTRFLTVRINQSLQVKESTITAQLVQLDMASFQVVAEKLGIKSGNP